MRVISLNLRIARKPEENNQQIREPRMAEFVRDMDAAAIGVQECSDFWRSRLDATWCPLGYVRVQCDPEKPETFKNYIFYNPEKADLLNSGKIWLSSTPEKASKDFGSQFYISAGWARLLPRGAKKPVVYVNTHLDVHSEKTRFAEIEVLLRYIRKFITEGNEVFVAGDFNARPLSDAYTYLTHQPDLREYRAAAKPNLDYTFNGYVPENETVPTPASAHIYIDHAFYTAGIAPKSLTIYEQYAGGNMSDHNGLVFDFEV